MFFITSTLLESPSESESVGIEIHHNTLVEMPIIVNPNHKVEIMLWWQSIPKVNVHPTF